MKFLILFVTFSLGLLKTASASATDTGTGTFSLGSTTVDVKVDTAYCPTDTSHAFDRAWLDIQVQSNANANEVMGGFIVCSELNQLRQGTPINLSRWILLMAPTQGKPKASPLVGVSRKQLIELLDTQLKKGVDIDYSDVTGKINKAASDVLKSENMAPIEIKSNNQPVPLGTSDSAAFLGLTLRIADGETDMKVGAVVGMTLVNDHMMSVNVYREFKEENTINQLLIETNKIMDDLLTINAD